MAASVKLRLLMSDTAACNLGGFRYPLFMIGGNFNVGWLA
jgi:hypothetical protein